MDPADRLPKAALSKGRRMHGFLVENVSELKELRAVACRLVHERSGARLLHLLTDDSENLLAIALRTPPPDDTGLPHILEHSVLCGSKKYPVKDPFVELLKRSLATFLNAMTYPDKTVYPCASMNEKDFFNLAGVYCDAVFNPLIREEHFKQEGYHLDFAEKGNIDSDLIIKGIVYNEMKGVYSDLDGIISRYAGRSICPDNAYGRDSGGDPESIPDLTYERFVNFHRNYYHPSNALIFLYGNIATERHLKFLDEGCLCGFEKISPDTSIGPQPRWDSPRRRTIPYPVAPDEDTRKKTAVVLTFLTNELTEAISSLSMNILEYYLLGNAASPLRKALVDSKLGEELTDSGYADYQRETFFTVGLKGTEPERADMIAELVRETCGKLAENGLDEDKLEASFHRLELRSREIQSMYPLHLMERVYRSWLYEADPLYNLRINEHLGELRRRYKKEPGFFEEMLRCLIVDNPHYTVLSFVPDRELSSRTEKKFSERMAAIKASMDRAELEDIARQAAELDAMQASPNPPEALATLPRLRLADVSPDPVELNTALSGIGDIPVLYTDLFSNGMSYIQLAFDLRGIDDELIDYLSLYADVLRKMGAGEYDYAAMAEREAAVSGGVSAGVSSGGRVDDTGYFLPVFTVSSKALDARLEDMLEVVFKRVLECDLCDLGRLNDIVLQGRVARRSDLIPNGGRYAALYASRRLSRNLSVKERMAGVSQLPLFDHLARNFDREQKKLREKLAAIKDFILQRGRLAVSFLGEEKSFELAGKYLQGVRDRLGTPAGLEETGAFRPLHGLREGLAAPSEVAFVAAAADAPELSHPDAPALQLLGIQLSYGYLWEKIRVKGGAYGAHAQYDALNGVFTFWSYRDPFIKETIDAFKGVCDFIAHRMDTSPESLEQAIIGTVKTLDRPIRPPQAVGLALSRYLSGETPEVRRAFRRRLLSLTGEDIRRVGREILGPGLERASICVLSSLEKLRAANRTMREESLDILDITHQP